MVNRPVRERSVEEIITAIKDGLAATGYDEVGILSLSSSDYTHILPLTQEIYRRLKDAHVRVSLPSLRIASFSVDLMKELKELSPGGGFTIAPEAATERLRAVINKPLDEDVLLETARTIFEHGWLNLKMYFMIGLPTETMEDVQAILDLGSKVHKIGRSIAGSRVHIHLGISTFIPKAHTPFQWYPMDTPENIQTKLDLLKRGARQAHLKMTYNLPEASQVESWLSRGDRRLGAVILQAWRSGAKFDAWSELLNLQAWQDAFAQVGLDSDFYTLRQRSLDEVLPWDHISTGVSKHFLITDLRLSQAERTREDCRNRCYNCGILDCFESIRPAQEEVYWGCP